MQATLKEILGLVGKLTDEPGKNTARNRFREYLKNNITEVGQLRDYIEESLRKSDSQCNRAFQDLVNHLGTFMGFKVNYGRYSGVPNEIGFDGHWISTPDDFHIVVEVKTSETYPIKTSKLLEYINQLISAKLIPADEAAIGLYVIGKPDPDVKQLKNAIIAENRIQKLRIISIDSLLSLAELMNEYDVTHSDILSILKPSGPSIDSTAEIMSRVAAQQKVEPPEPPKPEDEINYWLTPVRDEESATAEETIENLVAGEKLYAIGERTPGRKIIKSGDNICFYEAGKGVVAHAEVLTKPKHDPNPLTRNPEAYPYTFKLKNPKIYTETPVIINKDLRAQLDAFKDKDLDRPWAWFVQATRKITKDDFELLTSDDITSS